jgi:glycosyltransferase involved in cell wall biosynthesis
VLFLTHGLQVGGAERMTIDLVNRLDRTKITPLVVSLDKEGPMERFLDKNIELVRIPRSWRYDSKPAAELAKLIEERKIERIFALGFFCFYWSMLARRQTQWPVKIYVSLHTTKPRTFKEYLQTMLYTWLLRGDESLITVCHNQAKFLSAKYHVPLNRFRTIYNGVDTVRWTLPPSSCDRKAERAKWGISESSFVILHVAVFRREKRQVDAVRALQRFQSQQEGQSTLVFVGGGDPQIQQETRDLAKQLNLESSIVFAGPQEDLRPFYWMSDLFILPSISETFSVSVLEAMASGLPCVLSELGGATEVVVKGENGYCVPPANPEKLADTWLEVWKNRERWNKNVIRARIVDRFSLDKCLREYEDHLTSAIHE